MELFTFKKFFLPSYPRCRSLNRVSSCSYLPSNYTGLVYTYSLISFLRQICLQHSSDLGSQKNPVVVFSQLSMQRELEPVPREEQNFCARARSVTINTKKFFFSSCGKKAGVSKKKTEARRRPILLWPRAHRIESNKLSPLALSRALFYPGIIRYVEKSLFCGKST